jgi:hypothetical protein
LVVRSNLRLVGLGRELPAPALEPVAELRLASVLPPVAPLASVLNSPLLAGSGSPPPTLASAPLQRVQGLDSRPLTPDSDSRLAQSLAVLVRQPSVVSALQGVALAALGNSSRQPAGLASSPPSEGLVVRSNLRLVGLGRELPAPALEPVAEQRLASVLPPVAPLASVLNSPLLAGSGSPPPTLASAPLQRVQGLDSLRRVLLGSVSSPVPQAWVLGSLPPA